MKNQTLKEDVHTYFTCVKAFEGNNDNLTKFY